MCERDRFDVGRIAAWISANRYGRVALQFPDRLLDEAPRLARRLEALVDARLFVAADSTYAPCCVDEIAAAHVGADAIVHFGHACLSPARLPVLYAFEAAPLDVDELVARLADEPTALFYHTSYEHASAELVDKLRASRPSVFVATIATEPSAGERLAFGRRSPDGAERSRLVYVGDDDRTLFNLTATREFSDVERYDPVERRLVRHEGASRAKRIRRLVERCKDAERIGVLVCAPSAVDFASVVDRMKRLIRLNGKRCYVLALGKPNAAKLCNLYEIDAFVLVACAENELYDTREFAKPIVYPYELELALNASRDEYATEFYANFYDLLEGGRAHCDVAVECATDVSLITGRLRTVGMNDDSDSSAEPRRGEWALSEFGHGSVERAWRGLEQKLGETPVAVIQQGRRGIASSYVNEPQ